MKKTVKIGVIALTTLVLVLLVFFTSFVRIPTGYTGIVTTFGRVEDKTLEAGGHFKSPFQRIVKMDNREQREQLETLAFTKDTQELNITYSIAYAVNKGTAMNLYRNVGVSYFDTLIYPRITESIKNATKIYSADALIQNRNMIPQAVVDDVKDDLEHYGITLIGIFIEDLDFSDAYTNAVEAKQVADQKRLQNAIEQDQLTNEARQQAERDIIQAEANQARKQLAADADAYEILTKAEAEAAANEQLAKSITPELTAYLEIQKWNGQRVIEFSNATPIVPIDIK